MIHIIQGGGGKVISLFLSNPTTSADRNTNDYHLPWLKGVARLDPKFRQAFNSATQLISKTLQDLIKDFDYYLVTAIADKIAWLRGNPPQTVVGHHRFYKLCLNG